MATQTRDPSRRSVAELDGLQAFMREARRYPLLQAHEEVDLARRIERGDLTAKRRMILHNLRLVYHNAKDFAGRGLEMEDLVQAGVIGLNRASEKFDWRRGTRFSTYATWWIRQAIKREIDNTARLVRLPVHVVEQLARVEKVIGSLIRTKGREPTPAEIARAANLTVAQVENLLESARPALSLDARIGDTMIGPIRLETLEDGGPSVDETVSGEDVDKRLRDVITSRLTAREAKIIVERWGLGGQPPRTLQHIGDELGLTRERVRQLEEAALDKLRVVLPSPEAL